MTTDLITRARRGDGEAFRELVEPYRREGRASVRTWLYRVATSRCLNARRSAGRRTAVTWLEPYPDSMLPEEQYERSEAISLAFVTALQLLPARQRAVLVLRDVLGYRAGEVAAMLDSTPASVHSALKRARAGLRQDHRPAGGPADPAVAQRLADAYLAGDVDALVALLTDDVRIAMPPVPIEYVGRAEAATFFAALLHPHRVERMVPTAANGQPAFGAYLHGHSSGLLVVTVAGERVSSIVRFENSVLPWFGLPRAL